MLRILYESDTFFVALFSIAIRCERNVFVLFSFHENNSSIPSRRVLLCG